MAKKQRKSTKKAKKAGFLGNIPRFAWFIALAMVLLVPLPSFRATEDSESVVALGFGPSILGHIAGLFAEEAPAESNVRMDVFTVSGCPYGQRFVKETLPLIVDAYPGIDWRVWYVTSKTGEGYTAMHGAAEHEENVREVCIWETYGREKWLDFVLCHYDRNNFAECASENGIDAAAVENCKDTREAELIDPHFQKSSEFGVTGTPTIIFDNGEDMVVGAQPFSIFNQTIFKLETGQVVEEVEVTMVVVSPDDCPDFVCQPDWVATSLEEQFGANILLNVIDPDETDLDEILGATGYPLFLFDKSIEDSSAYADLSSYLAPAGDMYVLATRPTVLNRPVEKNRMDLFIMSQCPYGMAAADAVVEVVDALPELDVNVWYLAGEEGNGFTSLHGQPEVEEDIRQVCILENEPENFWDYVACMASVYRNAGTEWEGCADAAGVNKARLTTCWEGETGKELLRDNIALAAQLGFGSSPTFLMNGRYIMSGMPQTGADGIKEFVCILNMGMAGCEQTLTQQSTATGSC